MTDKRSGEGVLRQQIRNCDYEVTKLPFGNYI